MWFKRTPPPVERPAPPLAGPSIDQARTNIQNALEKITMRQTDLESAREITWRTASDEIDRLTIEISNSQIVAESYRSALRGLDAVPPAATNVPTLDYPCVPQIDDAELSRALTEDGMICGGEPIPERLTDMPTKRRNRSSK